MTTSSVVTITGMDDHPPLPEFGDELGLFRMVRRAKARVQASARPPAERAAIIAEIERQYRAAVEDGLAGEVSGSPRQ